MNIDPPVFACELEVVLRIDQRLLTNDRVRARVARRQQHVARPSDVLQSDEKVEISGVSQRQVSP